MYRHYFSRKSLFSCSVALLFLWCSSNVFSLENPIIKSGDDFPPISLMLPPDSGSAPYLGVDGKKPFFINDIKADLVLVEMMNINCGSCQRQAPVYNDLFDKIQSSQDYKDKIKIIAIGAGNQNVYIKKYQDHFKAPYPIVEDPGLKMYNAIGKSAVPFAIYVRIDQKSGKAWVLTTHTGFQHDHEAMFNKMTSLLAMDEETIRQNASQAVNEYVKVRSVITEDELMEKVKTAFQNENKNFVKIETMLLGNGDTVFVGSRKAKNPSERIFAKMVSQPPPCDLCHDTHYIYVFDDKGRILQFIPVQLTKYGNKKWTSDDIAQMQQKLEGQFIYQPFQYDAKVDAITSATITSLVIIQSLNEGKSIFSELQSKGLVE